MKRTLGVCLPTSFQRGSTDQGRPILNVNIITMCRGPRLYLKRKKVTDRLSTNIQTSPGLSRFEQATSRACCLTLSPDPSTYEQAASSDCRHTVSSVKDWTLSKWCEKMNSSAHKFISVRYFVTKTEKQSSTKQNLLVCGKSFQNFLIKSVSIRGKGILFQYNNTT